MDKKVMRKVGMTMSIFMGVTMSFFLSLVGNLTSGHFTVPSWIIGFLVSTVISLIIGFVVPMKLVGDKAVGALKLRTFSFPARLVESFISDLIYTPLMTFCMVFMAYKQAIAHGAPAESLNLGKMFLGSCCICFVVAFVIILIVTPIFMKITFKKYGIDPAKRPEEKRD